MVSKKEGKPEKKLFPMEWKVDNPIIPRVNAFNIMYSLHSAILMVGIIDPETLIKGAKRIEEGKPLIIQTLARFNLDIEDFLTLKSEVDRAFEGLKKIGGIR